MLVFAAPVLLTVLSIVLTFVTLVLTALSRLLTVVILVVFAPAVLLTVVILLPFNDAVLLTVVRLLLIVKTAPVFGIAVSKDPSPTNFAKIVPAEIVEKNP